MRCHRRVEWGKECCCWAASLPPWQVPGVGLRPGLQLSGGPPDLCGDIAGKVSSVFIIEQGELCSAFTFLRTFQKVIS